MGRFREAVSDVAETLRRLFRDPPVAGGELHIGASLCETDPTLVAEGRSHDPVPTLVLGHAPYRPEAPLMEAPMPLETRLHEEQAWETWASESKVCAMEPLHAGRSLAAEVSPLPRQAVGRRLPMGLESMSTRKASLTLGSPRVRNLDPELVRARVLKGLGLMEALPVTAPGQVWAQLNKSLQMRYSLELVKATGENIRSVEVLGVFLIPQKGVREMRHDPPNNRLLLHLGPEARSAQRRAFLLARRKADGSLLSCFLEG